MIYVFLTENFHDNYVLPEIENLKKEGREFQTVSLTEEKKITGLFGAEINADISVTDESFEPEKAELLILPYGKELGKVVADLKNYTPPEKEDPEIGYRYLCKAIEMILDKETITSNAIQRGLRIGFNRAADITDRLEELGFISKRDGSNPRKVLVTPETYEKFRKNHERGN